MMTSRGEKPNDKTVNIQYENDWTHAGRFFAEKIIETEMINAQEGKKPNEVYAVDMKDTILSPLQVGLDTVVASEEAVESEYDRLNITPKVLTDNMENNIYDSSIADNCKSDPTDNTATYMILSRQINEHVYKSLPNGKPLTSEDLRRDLENLIEKYKSKASSLRNLGSTQANESFNHSMNEAALLSPGEYTKSIAKKLDTEKLKRKIKRQSLATIGLSDTEAITIPSPLKLDGTESFTFFDLETTGLSRVSDITQIAAVHDKKLYQSYVFLDAIFHLKPQK
ncbi:unnamed protein product [Mytilus edulis]|uniref:Exonuclease domain-containing protein n=1 Tax=Mytilus edulis TaxID=6550 RepID=A0A8S3TAC5_MYTED|nr:unnamed protein product [Mytilus edulis]